MTLVYHATAHKLEAWFAMKDETSSFSLISQMMADDPKAHPTVGDLKILVYSPTCKCNYSAFVDSHKATVKESPDPDGCPS